MQSEGLGRDPAQRALTAGHQLRSLFPGQRPATRLPRRPPRLRGHGADGPVAAEGRQPAHAVSGSRPRPPPRPASWSRCWAAPPCRPRRGRDLPGPQTAFSATGGADRRAGRGGSAPVPGEARRLVGEAPEERWPGRAPPLPGLLRLRVQGEFLPLLQQHLGGPDPLVRRHRGLDEVSEPSSAFGTCRTSRSCDPAARWSPACFTTRYLVYTRCPVSS